jgi:hypothetical protein
MTPWPGSRPIFEPDGSGKASLIGRVPAGDWSRAARGA